MQRCWGHRGRDRLVARAPPAPAASPVAALGGNELLVARGVDVQHPVGSSVVVTSWCCGGIAQAGEHVPAATARTLSRQECVHHLLMCISYSNT